MKRKIVLIVGAPTTAAGATVPRCTHASQVYSEGAVSCQEGREFRCNNGIWERTAAAC